MRTYGKVYTSFWTDEKTGSLSSDAQRVALYLLTGPHSNSIGCFRLPLPYLMTDLRLSEEDAKAALATLESMGFIVRDQSSGWTLIVNYLRHNAPENGKVGKSMMPLIAAVPAGSEVWFGLVERVCQHEERFPSGYTIGLLRTRDTVSRHGNETRDTVSGRVSDTVSLQTRNTVSRHGNPSQEPPNQPEPVLYQGDSGRGRSWPAGGGVR
ncbi:hypothetical protein E6C67_26685 [Azospirillum sp. TSA2s]|uniref:hypothetical protein n=1 Tax=Azospirillum sp. TSA2s TaxID=709810 RepID=UPI0010AAE3B7|nr:hypothetical protein [Azospirillum sp. TSA2s]QCG97362.1 hypothetical protein E6C67_26685 [Azospirillum sp. TSA2s]